MPIFSFHCAHCDKQHDAIVDRDTEKHECPDCGDAASKVPSTFGGYSIRGNNSASVRPKQAGSFKGKKP